MPTYAYEALNAAGKPQSGTIEANNSDEAVQRIKGEGFFPTAVREQKVKGDGSVKGTAKVKKKKKKGAGFNISIGRVSRKHLTLFTRQLSTLQDAGLPLLRSIQILEAQQKPGQLKAILAGVAEDVEGGTTLSDSMARQPKAFDRLYCKMVNAGEIGGVLDVILQRLANFLEKAQRLRRRVIGALIYPVVVIMVAVVIVTGIMVFVIPKFQEIFNDFNVELPGLTVWLIGVSLWVAGQEDGQMVPGAVWILCSPFIVFLFLTLIRKTGPGRAVTDILVLRIPVLGGMLRKTAVARFTRTLGTLIAAGVPILEAINITRDTTGSEVYARMLNKVHDAIREGDTFANPLRASKRVDAIVVNMVDVGEETGELDKMLYKVADNYDDEVDTLVNSLVSLLEPIMVIGLGGIVGFIVISLYMPMIALIQTMTSQ